MPTSRRIFLAHAHEDKDQVLRLYDDLKARGYDPWLDKKDLIAGQNWREAIPRVIEQAGVFLACLSRASVAKTGFVQEEYRVALSSFGRRPQGSIYFVPARFDDCEIPDLQVPDRGLKLRDIHWVDLWEDDGFDKLLKAIELALGTSPSGDGAFSHDALVEAPTAADKRKPGTIFRDIDASWCPEMVVIPPGRFVMGSLPEEEGRDDDDGPQHRVEIARPFALGRYAVTFEEFDEFVLDAGYEHQPEAPWGRGRMPVVNVSWDDANAYCQWLSEKTGEDYRLSSEAEWEYACRARTVTPFYFGETVSTDQANYDGNSTYGLGSEGQYRKATVAVDMFEPNAFGLYQMHGNVWEWCEDPWHGTYVGAPRDGSVWIKGGNDSLRVLRGGSWINAAVSLRSADRYGDLRDDRFSSIGFRGARTL